MIQVRQTRPMKLKDKKGRQRINLPLKATFGFVPETLIIEKIRGENNTIRVSAILTEAELKKEQKEGKKK